MTSDVIKVAEEERTQASVEMPTPPEIAAIPGRGGQVVGEASVDRPTSKGKSPPKGKDKGTRAPRRNAPRPTPYLVGHWSHNVGTVRSVFRIELRADGSIWRDGWKQGDWELMGSNLTLRWPHPESPGGAWIDRVMISADGYRYEGTNQQGNVISGDCDLQS